MIGGTPEEVRAWCEPRQQDQDFQLVVTVPIEARRRVFDYVVDWSADYAHWVSEVRVNPDRQTIIVRNRYTEDWADIGKDWTLSRDDLVKATIRVAAGGAKVRGNLAKGAAALLLTDEDVDMDDLADVILQMACLGEYTYA